MEQLISEFVRQGLLGLFIVAFIMGWIVPRPTVDVLRKEIEVRDKIIDRQSAVIERLAERGGTPTTPSAR